MASLDHADESADPVGRASAADPAPGARAESTTARVLARTASPTTARRPRPGHRQRLGPATEAPGLTYALAETPDAFRYVASHRKRGMVLVAVTEEEAARAVG